MEQQQIYNAAIYCRLSRDDETNGDSLSIQNQKSMLTRYAQDNQWRVADCYIDDGISGTTFERGGFKRMLDDIEQGKINLVLTKDLSRLGRDYLKTGYYTEVYFPENNVRYIALNDGIDTLNQNNDIAPFKNILNEMYAKDISRKIKSAYKVKFARGDYQGAFAPFGYAKDPDNHNKLIVDEESAAIVRKIFELSGQGYGCSRIRTYLVENKCLTPSAYLNKVNPSKYYVKMFQDVGPDDYIRYAWSHEGVCRILHNEIYIGNITHYKEISVSYKTKRRQVNPKEKWVSTEGTHQPLISRELWDIVQERSKAYEGKWPKCNEPNIFIRIVKCVDCGRNMWLAPPLRNKEGKIIKKRYFQCATNRDYGKHKCTIHNTSFEHMYRLVLDDIRSYAKLAMEKPDKLIALLTDADSKKRHTENKRLRREHEQNQKRLDGLPGLLHKLFEQNASGMLNDSNYTAMFTKYQKEQEQLEYRQKELDRQLAAMDDAVDNVRKWMDLIAKYADLKQLDAPIINELCEKILVHESAKVDGVRTQKIEIYYRFIGIAPAMAG